MKHLIAFLILCLLPQGQLQPIAIQVPDVTNWHYGAGSGMVQFEGTAVGSAGYHSAISIPLSVKPQFGVYTMKFSVANYFYSYPGPYEAMVSIGTKEFCSTYGWAIGAFTEVTLTCPVSNYFTLYNGYGFDASQDIALSFNATGWPIYLKDVSLTFTPTQ